MDFRRVPQIGDITAGPQRQPAGQPTSAPEASSRQAVLVPQSTRAGNKGGRRLALWGVCGIILILAVAGCVLFLFLRRNSGPLPGDITKSAGFTLYYPSPIPTGYKYKKDSAKIENGIVFYTLQKGSLLINVSEQPVPPNPPDINHLVGFTAFSTLSGNAALGTTLGNPSAILLTNTALITIISGPHVPRDVVGTVTKNMGSLTN